MAKTAARDEKAGVSANAYHRSLNARVCRVLGWEVCDWAGDINKSYSLFRLLGRWYDVSAKVNGTAAICSVYSKQHEKVASVTATTLSEAVTTAFLRALPISAVEGVAGTRVCRHCLTRFTPEKPNQTACSPRCAKRWFAKIRKPVYCQCPGCGCTALKTSQSETSRCRECEREKYLMSISEATTND